MLGAVGILLPRKEDNNKNCLFFEDLSLKISEPELHSATLSYA
jgi:hypothetical protein